MKKFATVLCHASITAITAIALNGCTADDFPESKGGDYNTVIEVTSEAPAPDSRTRTAIDPTEYTSGEIGVNWLPKDKIGVYGDKGSANTLFENRNGNESNKASFAGNLAAGEKPVYAYYPYSATAGNSPEALKGVLPLTQHYSTATRELEGDWKVGVPVDGSSSRFSFSHIFAFLKFDINAGGTLVAGEKLLSVALTIEGKQLGGEFTYNIPAQSCTFMPLADADCVTMEWTDKPALTESTFHGYMNVAPVEGIAGKNIDIVITTSKHIVKFSQTVKADRFLPNTYYTVPLTLERFTDVWSVEDNPDAEEDNAAWVPGLDSRLACANTVFAVPGKPFMHKIRVPQSSSQTGHGVVPVKTGVVRAYNLPEGLTWNEERCLVSGIAPAAGVYTYSVEFVIDGQTYKEGIHLTVSDNLVSPTPMMGWQSWNVLKYDISEDIIKNQADRLVALGLRDAGYTYIGIDDCWQQQSGRDSDGRQIPFASKFPNGMKVVTDYLHSLGLKAGIYSDCGTVTCEGYEASYGNEAIDGQAYIDWGFDMLKEDWFWSGHGDNNGALDPADVGTARELYGRMGAALGGKAMLYMCEWGIHNPWKWAAEVGAQCWRMSYDARDGWWGCTGTGSGSKNGNDENKNGVGLHNTLVLMRYLWPYAGINRYNDADMLCVGIRGTGKSSNDCVYGVSKSGDTYYTGSLWNKKTYEGMSDVEYETNFAMWCMYNSPLLLSIDMTRTDINQHDLDLMRNKELIAINQDQLGQAAEYVKTEGDMDYYMKDLANGDVAIAVVNLGDNAGSYTVSLPDYDALDKDSAYAARNLIAKTGAGTLSASAPLTGSLAAHGTFVIRLTKQ